jgi:hypothetical protein
MSTKPNCPVIALEEHYLDEEMASHFTGAEARRAPDMGKRLLDLGETLLADLRARRKTRRASLPAFGSAAPSGNFSTPALLCCVMEMGVDRILFAVDYPFVANPPATRWMDGVPLSEADKAKILSGNAQRLLRM